MALVLLSHVGAYGPGYGNLFTTGGLSQYDTGAPHSSRPHRTRGVQQLHAVRGPMRGRKEQIPTDKSWRCVQYAYGKCVQYEYTETDWTREDFTDITVPFEIHEGYRTNPEILRDEFSPSAYFRRPGKPHRNSVNEY